MPTIQSNRASMQRAESHLNNALTKARRIHDSDLSNLATAVTRDLTRIDTAFRSSNPESTTAERATALARAGAIASLGVLGQAGVQVVTRERIRSQIAWNGNFVERVNRHKHYANRTARDLRHTEGRIQEIMQNGRDIGRFVAEPYTPLVATPRNVLRGAVAGGIRGMLSLTGARRAGTMPGIGGLLNSVVKGGGLLASVTENSMGLVGSFARVAGKINKSEALSRVSKNVGRLGKGAGILGAGLTVAGSFLGNRNAGVSGRNLLAATALDSGFKLAGGAIGKAAGKAVGVKAGVAVAAKLALVPPPGAGLVVGAAVVLGGKLIGSGLGKRLGGAVSARVWPMSSRLRRR